MGITNAILKVREHRKSEKFAEVEFWLTVVRCIVLFQEKY